MEPSSSARLPLPWKPHVITLQLVDHKRVDFLQALERTVGMPLDIETHVPGSPRDPVDARFHDVPHVERRTKRFDLETEEAGSVPPLSPPQLRLPRGG